MALGATPRDVLGLVVGGGARLTAIGLALGVALALAGSRLLSGMTFGVSARDPLTLAGVVVAVAAAALAACYILGRRAVGVDPAIALRVE